jgi:hypothetical protein
LPPSDPRRRRKPARKRPGSIRDAAASAASVPAPGGPTPPSRGTPPSGATPPGGATTPSRATSPGRATPSPRPRPQRPAVPDFDAASAGWEPWDQAIEGPPGGDGGFDPNRTLGDWFEAVIPAEAQVHFIRAGQEFAAGVQTTVDHHLGRRERDDEIDGASRIEIE